MKPVPGAARCRRARLASRRVGSRVSKPGSHSPRGLMRAPPGHLRFHFQSEAPSFESLLFFAGKRVGGQQRLPFDDPPPPLPDSGCNFDEPHEDSLASLLRLRNEAVHGRPRAGRLLLLAHCIANTATLRVALAWLGADAQRQDHAGNRTPRSSRGYGGCWSHGGCARRILAPLTP